MVKLTNEQAREIYDWLYKEAEKYSSLVTAMEKQKRIHKRHSIKRLEQWKEIRDKLTVLCKALVQETAD